jgi:capsular exopolysaccharide synthesis family protein
MVIIIIAYVLTPPEYIARTKLLIESQNYTRLNSATMVLNNEFSYFETLPELMRSKPVIRLAAKSLGVGEGTKDFNSMCSRLIHDLHVNNLPDSLIFTVYIKSRDPVFAANATNAIVESYIKFLDEQRQKRIQGITFELQEELNSLKNKVEKSEMDLIKYVQKQELNSNGFIISWDEPNYNTGTKALSELQTKYIALQIELANLLQKYKDKYPLVSQLKNELNALTVKTNIMKQAMLKGDQKRIEYIMLSRDVELNKDLYNILTKELKNVNIFNDINYTTVTIIEHAAIPTQRSNHGVIFWLIFGSIASIVAGIVSGMMVDQLDSSIEGERDIETFVKYPIIGVLPFLQELKIKEPNKLINIINSNSSQRYTEALRLLRTNLKYSSVGSSKGVLLVTSTAKNEGKTTAAASLAYILSITGAKVLLLDADVKKPTIHKLFNSETMPGYTELLIDERLELMDVIKQSNYDSLYYLTSGRQSPNLAELLDSQRSKELIKKLRTSFDYVIIDSPPLGIISDAAILSSEVDDIIFVVKVNGYPREQIIRSIMLLESIDTKITGIILTYLNKNIDYYDYYNKLYNNTK